MAQTWYTTIWRTVLRQPETPEESKRRKRRERRQRRKDPKFVPGVGIPKSHDNATGGAQVTTHLGTLLGYFKPLFTFSKTTGQQPKAITEAGASQDAALVSDLEIQILVGAEDARQRTEEMRTQSNEPRDSDTASGGGAPQDSQSVIGTGDAPGRAEDVEGQGEEPHTNTGTGDFEDGDNGGALTEWHDALMEWQVSDGAASKVEEERNNYDLAHFERQTTESNDVSDSLPITATPRLRAFRSYSQGTIYQAPTTLQYQLPIVGPGRTASVQRHVYRPSFPPRLEKMNEDDFKKAFRASCFAFLSHHTLADYMWRTVIFANYFSDINPAEIDLPRHFHFLSPEQQRFEIAVKESGLIDTDRPSVYDRRAVEDAVMLFLDRTYSLSQKFAWANRQMALELHWRLQRERPVTPYMLYKMFITSYGRPQVPETYLKVDLRGLELLFDSS